MLHFYQQLVSMPSDSARSSPCYFFMSYGHGTSKVAVQDLEGFWKAQKQVILDIWTVLHGEERKAVRMALWIALIDQAMGSTAVVNYAPQVPLPLTSLFPHYLRRTLHCSDTGRIDGEVQQSYVPQLRLPITFSFSM